MNKKIIALFLGLMAFGASEAMAARPFFSTGASSAYSITNSTVSISSNVSTVLAAAAGYREFKIQFLPTASQLSSGTSVFFRIDGSSVNVSTVGYIVQLATTTNGTYVDINWSEETNGPVFGQLAPGVSGSVATRMTQKKLRQ